MIRLTPESIAKAIDRSFEKKCRVRAISSNEIELICANNHTHIIHFERRGADLFGECVMAKTGELCPSALGKRACYHLSSALPLYLAITEGGIGRDVPESKSAVRAAAPAASFNLTRRANGGLYFRGFQV